MPTNKRGGLNEALVTDQVTSFLEYRGWRMVRNQSAFVTRTDQEGRLMSGFRVGELGMPDWTAIHYMDNGVALVMWIEMKREGVRMSCRCKEPVGKRRGKTCTMCAQKAWRENERRFSRDRAVIVRVDDFQAFAEWYQTAYGWLHAPETGRGQLELVG